MAKKIPYTKPFFRVKQQRLTLEQFKEDFDSYLEEDLDFKGAIILDARVIDDPNSIKDGAVVFDCYLPAINCEGTFIVSVLHSDILN